MGPQDSWSIKQWIVMYKQVINNFGCLVSSISFVNPHIISVILIIYLDWDSYYRKCFKYCEMLP